MVSILLGNGNGSFQPALNFIPEFTIDEIKVDDVNQDGFSDLLLIRKGVGEGVLYGTPDGQFSWEKPKNKQSKTEDEEPLLLASNLEQSEDESVDEAQPEETKKRKKFKKKKKKKKKKKEKDK